ncbi:MULTISPECIES: hypothetical protein [Agrobacterium]|jgi:hypothetical protein|uniref:Uncharacterized protein n=1 Tax=Agrobacterium pusense TaxID=648995 RepID=A0A6H0ZLI4_9HYPH|nr:MULTISPECIES: hypothetical protein [Agrobacterium]ANV23172.1 hypothetical protein BA939_03995 [Rhizobium sp. S41]KGE80777.1 hypothetical protein LW14_20800 [Rhizobium sp. H41]HAU78760.1 hypothetical protein [Agrobacterium sp.]MDH0869005.1 hypothetical protein [Agrobacterium pusense]MDH1267782.1 hypothetical protein [Agrobacterium pusense]
MEKDVAKSIIELSISIDTILGQMFECIEKISDEKIKFALYKSANDLMGYIARDIIFPLIEIHPELNPES